jgi:hypothetical protein
MVTWLWKMKPVEANQTAATLKTAVTGVLCNPFHAYFLAALRPLLPQGSSHFLQDGHVDRIWGREFVDMRRNYGKATNNSMPIVVTPIATDCFKAMRYQAP